MLPNTKPVKVGIAGLGRSGWDIHAAILAKLNEKFELVSVFDLDSKRQKQAKDRFNCRTYSNYDEFLEDRDTELVIIALPNYLHASYSMEALNVGKHVLCEKPMSTSLRDADMMIAAASKACKVLTIFQNQRYAPDFQVVKRIIDSGCLGRIVLIRIARHGFGRRWDWQTLKRFGGGTLNNTGPHILDQALVLFGDEQPSVYCRMEKTLTLGDAEDHVKVIISGKNSPTIEIEITAACAYPQPMWLVMGTQGGLSGTEERLQWKFFNPAELPVRKVETTPTPDRSYNSEDIPWTEDMWELEKGGSHGEIDFYLDLYETLVYDKPLVITPESVWRQIWLLDKCHKLSPV
ncbi:MAG: Gfo/Idh/MocA family oxidoreductase [Spirochaetota bacterium]